MSDKLRSTADALVAHCRNHTEAEGLNTLYTKDAVSVEAADMGSGRETRGLDGIRGKHEWWNQNMEVSKGTVDGPYLHGDDRFAVIFEVEGKEKATDKPFSMKEVGIYHVDKDGKINREEFYYTM